MVLSMVLLPALAFAFSSPGRATGFVNDFSGTLSAGDKVALEEQLMAIQKQTSAEISIAVVPTIGRDETIETYAVKLFEEWGIGQKGKDNGALIVVAVQDHVMRIEVGYGLEGIITDARAFAIVDKILTPAFKANDFAGGLTQAVAVMGQAIAGDPSALPRATTNQVPVSSNAFFALFFFGLVVIRGLITAMARSKSWWFGGVLGAVAAGIISFFIGFLYFGLIALIVLVPLGLLVDWYVSKKYVAGTASGAMPWWLLMMRGGGRGSWGGGGFGGFGGGRSGGGGASGRW